MGFFYTFAPAFYLAGIDAKKIKNGEFGHVSLELNKQISGETPLVINNKLSLIGSTEKFILFYTHNDDMCIVVPLTNIASLRLSANSTIDKYHRFLPF